MTDEQKIARINEISTLARTAWFTLLAYLVFVGITLLGVEDADFFVPARQTQLPLVGVQIPTASFFWAAPILGAALYVYLHLFLLKLWDEIAEMPSQVRTHDERPEWRPLSEVIHPWLVNDYACKLKGPDAHPARPLHRLSAFVTWLLVWLAGPFVIGYAWARSMPAHDEWLTLFISLSLFIATIAGAVSWQRARERLRNRPARLWRRLARLATGTILLAFLIALSWDLTEGYGFDDTNLAPTNFAGVELVPLPPDWRDFQTARMVFRETWCKREGLGMSICDHRKSNDRTPPGHVEEARAQHCETYNITDCVAEFARLDKRFDKNWLAERASLRASLPALDLSREDLRRADMSRASLVGAVLIEARMGGASLKGAQMEGANLRQAQMEGADLTGAQMEGADLLRTQMEGVSLRGVQMEGAVLSGARMKGADLREAQLEGANLRQAQLEGANLRDAESAGANLSGAQLRGASLRGAILRSVDWAGAQVRSPAQSADFRGSRSLSQDHLDQMIGNMETLLPVSDPPLSIPSCWRDLPASFATIYRMFELRFGLLIANDIEFLCPEGEEPQPTGTPCALDLTREECLDPLVNPHHPKAIGPRPLVAEGQ